MLMSSSVQGFGDELCGGGGCIAYALWKLGVFKSQKTAMATLNACAERLYQGKLHQDKDYPRNKVYIKDMTWCPEAVQNAVQSVQFMMKKILTSDDIVQHRMPVNLQETWVATFLICQAFVQNFRCAVYAQRWKPICGGLTICLWSRGWTRFVHWSVFSGSLLLPLLRMVAIVDCLRILWRTGLSALCRKQAWMFPLSRLISFVQRLCRLRLQQERTLIWSCSGLQFL